MRCGGPPTPAAGQLLTFRLHGRDHALPVEDVVEVLRMVAPTPLPDAPSWISGVINVRGRVIPLMDLRTRLGGPRIEPDVSTPIIVVEADHTAAGLVVDEVVEVLALSCDAVSRPGPLTSAATAVSGVARDGDRLILVLDCGCLCRGTADLPSFRR
jgi:purine-binding chemotaxis protein CheW